MSERVRGQRQPQPLKAFLEQIVAGLYSFVFSARRQSAADMSFGFVEFKNFFYLKVKRFVYVLQPLGQIFMYS